MHISTSSSVLSHSLLNKSLSHSTPMVHGLTFLNYSRIQSAVDGLVHAYKHGASASTWLITSDRPAEDITDNVSKGYEIMSQGVFS